MNDFKKKFMWQQELCKKTLNLVKGCNGLIGLQKLLIETSLRVK